MLLIEPLERINQLLQREYGVWEDGQTRFRVVWSNDQFEKRMTDCTDEGFQLLHPEVRLLPKYSYIKDRYVLEQLSVVPPGSDVMERLSYEPLWVFEDRFQQYLPPRFDMSKVLIDNMYQRKNMVKPVLKEDSEEVLNKRAAELKEIELKLFGNETPVGDALAYGWGVTVPGTKDNVSNETNEAKEEN